MMSKIIVLVLCKPAAEGHNLGWGLVSVGIHIIHSGRGGIREGRRNLFWQFMVPLVSPDHAI